MMIMMAVAIRRVMMMKAALAEGILPNAHLYPQLIDSLSSVTFCQGFLTKSFVLTDVNMSFEILTVFDHLRWFVYREDTN